MAAKPLPDGSQPLKGKYDGRKNNRFRIPHRKGINSRCKPNWLKTLGAKHAADVLEELDAILPPAEIYKQAIARNDFRLVWEIRTAVEYRLLGKPFVAVNPETLPPTGSILNQDNRLQVAVSNLIVQTPESKGRKIRKGLAPDALLIEASCAQSGDTARDVDNKGFVGFDDVVL